MDISINVIPNTFVHAKLGQRKCSCFCMLNKKTHFGRLQLNTGISRKIQHRSGKWVNLLHLGINEDVFRTHSKFETRLFDRRCTSAMHFEESQTVGTTSLRVHFVSGRFLLSSKRQICSLTQSNYWLSLLF